MANLLGLFLQSRLSARVREAYDNAVFRRVPRLLVSVARADEVDAAIAGGADIIDLKNPSEGPLGAPEPALIKNARPRVATPLELSVALGEGSPGSLALAASGAALLGADYVKVGLAGNASEASALLRALQSAISKTRLIAVAYADGARVSALAPSALPPIAAEAGAFGVMLDTLSKESGSTIEVMGLRGVEAFVDFARALGLLSAVAGSLSLADVERLPDLGVDVVGVRRSACEGGRLGSVSTPRVRELSRALRTRVGSLESARS
jgi:uncharacterized protein (UPF0264 family)